MRRVLLLIASAALLGACVQGHEEDDGGLKAEPTSSAPADLAIEGYLTVGDRAATTIAASAKALTTVGIDGVTVESGGASVTDVPEAAAPAVQAAHDAGLDAELLVANFDGELGDFSPERATELLSSEAHRQAVADQLVAEVTEGDYDGLQLDLESLDASHTDGLVDLARRVRDALPVRAGLSMAVQATGTADGYADLGYDLDALSEHVDRFVLMGYDQHGPDWSEAGPVGGTPWVEQVLGAFLDTGVAPDRVDLGVATFGYRWDDDEANEDYLTVPEARRLAGDAATWDDEQQEWTAELADGTRLWWSDSRTVDLRKVLARTEQLHGLAIWELGTGEQLG